VLPPFNKKTISFIQNNIRDPIFQLVAVPLQFDDLYGNEADYYYKIIRLQLESLEIPKTNTCRVLTTKEFRITTTLSTPYKSTHYTLSIPNQFTQQLLISGNYT
jgi:hypothetical protein